MMQSVGDLTLKGLHYGAAFLNMTSRRQWLARVTAGLYVGRTRSTRMYGVHRVFMLVPQPNSTHQRRNQYTPKWKDTQTSHFPTEPHTQTVSEALVVTFLGFFKYTTTSAFDPTQRQRRCFLSKFQSLSFVFSPFEMKYQILALS